jgi:hypothetical protein
LSDLNEAIERAPRQEIWYESRAATRRGLGDEAGAKRDDDQAKKIAAHKQGKAELD